MNKRESNRMRLTAEIVFVMIQFQTNLAYFRLAACSCILIFTTLTGAVALQLRPDCSNREFYCTLSMTFLHQSVNPYFQSMLGSKALYHLPQHCVLVRSGTNEHGNCIPIIETVLLHSIHGLLSS
jgi:hypothetical protein